MAPQFVGPIHLVDTRPSFIESIALLFSGLIRLCGNTAAGTEDPHPAGGGYLNHRFGES